MESTKNCTTLRLLHYPRITEDSVIEPGQIRCGEHTDYGSITLLFQDDMPGLEVLHTAETCNAFSDLGVDLLKSKFA